MILRFCRLARNFRLPGTEAEAGVVVGQEGPAVGGWHRAYACGGCGVAALIAIFGQRAQGGEAWWGPLALLLGSARFQVAE